MDLRQRIDKILVEPADQPSAADTLPGNDEEWTEIELAIRSALSSLAPPHAKRIRRNTTIYQLGLDSISAVQIASMLRKQGLKVSAGDLIENPTCASLARRVQGQTSDLNRSADMFDLGKLHAQITPEVKKRGFQLETIETVLPATPLQAGMMAQFIKSEGRDYFNLLSFELDHGIDINALAHSWRIIANTHSILRTGFLSTEIQDFSFAMLQYRLEHFEVPVTVLSEEQSTVFDLDKWHLEISLRTSQQLYSKLWGVAITQKGRTVAMHLAIHHAIYDASSLRALLRDLGRVLRHGKTPPQTSTRAVVVDILGQLSAPTDCEIFWREQAAKVAINRFPVMTALRKETRSIAVESMTGKESFQTLERASASAGYSFHPVLQAAWTRVLSSYLGETSVVYGVVLSGRNTEVTRQAVFPCITTLPVVSTNMSSNRDLLENAFAYNTELYKQQHQPLIQIQKWLGRSDARLFDTILVYQKYDLGDEEPLPWRVIEDRATIDYPVSIEVEPKPDGSLSYQVTFFSDVLPVEQARILLAQLDATVRHLCFKPDGEESDLVANSPEMFSVLPPQQPELPSPVQLLHQFVELQARNRPEKSALQFVDGFNGVAPICRSWTYAELDANGNRVANALLKHVKVGEIIALDFGKCPEAFFCILGILKSGCAFVALDPGAPASRKKFILEDSGAAVLLTSANGKPDIAQITPVPFLRVNEEFLENQPTTPPTLDRAVEPSDVCYCLYTSGTTGTPKGCEITHDNAVQCMLAFQHIFEGNWDEDSKWLQFASLHFDVSVLEQYWSWSVGITLVGAPRDLILEDLAGTISRLGITHIDLTPSLARLLHPEDVPSLCRGVFITGGETLKQEILDVWGSRAVIYNFYGPTEATIGVTVYPRVPTNGRFSNIGQQFVNVGSYVLHPGTEIPVLRGAVGELCVSGRLVGKGYLNRCELTAERFPTLRRFRERVYRTGDLVRVLHDGCFDFLGRADDQVKLRGQRLEIAEINHVIKNGIAEVDEVATLVIRNEAQQKDFLVSFVVVRASDKPRRDSQQLAIVKSPEASDLCRRVRQECRSRLPGYMIPTYVFQLPFTPLSPNNKAELKELRALFNGLSQDELVSVSSTPEHSPGQLSDAGKRVVSVLAKMNGIDPSKILASSTVFDFGVDSISVLRFSRALREAGLPQASPATVLRHHVIEDLAHALETNNLSTVVASVAAARQLVQACSHRYTLQACRELGISQSEIEYVAPCSPLQQGMISRSAVDGAYFNTFCFRLTDGVAISRLRGAWQTVLDTFSILRTHFVNTADGCVQVALKSLRLPWEDLSVDSQLQAEEALADRRREWITQNQVCFNRPWEILLLQGDEGTEYGRLLALNIFHGLYDGNSFKLLVDAVISSYLSASNLTNGTSEAHDAVSPSFLEAMCHGPLRNFTSSRPFWEGHLEGVSEPSPRFAKASETGSSSYERLLDTFRDSLTHKLGVTHQAVVQAAWVLVLARHYGAGPTIGVITSGRTINLDGADRVVGPLFNALPFHVRVSSTSSASTAASTIRQCHEFSTAVLDFQHVPLRDIQKWCSGGKALFNVLFSFQREESTAPPANLLWTEVESAASADYPLALEATLMLDRRLRLVLVAQGGDAGSDLLPKLMDDLEDMLASMQQGGGVAGAYTPVGVNEATRKGPDVNGIMTNGDAELESRSSIGGHFTWTKVAITIRDEVAILSGLSSDLIMESTSLFELGLDSIDLIKLSARLKRHGIAMKPSELMKAGSVLGISRLAETHDKSGQVTNGHSNLHNSNEALRKHLLASGNDLDDVETLLPATPLQDSMVADMIDSDFQLYFNHDVLRFTPDVDIDRLRGAWQTVIGQSPILRTTFLPVDDPHFDFAYCQVVNKEPVHHLYELELESTEDIPRVINAATQTARKCCGRSGLLQLSFVRISDDRFLILSIAHALYDGWSLNLLHRDVRLAYHGQFKPRQPYSEYLDQAFGAVNAAGTEFWVGYLDGAAETLWKPKDNAQAQRVCSHREETVSSVAIGDIKTFCKQHAISLQALGQACWAAVLGSRVRSLDVTFGVVLSGRESEASEDLMFPTMNTVAVRSILHGNVASWLRYMHDNMVNISAYQHFPLRKAQRIAKGIEGPLFNTLFILQRSIARLGESDEPMMTSINGSSSTEYPVCVEMEPSEFCLTWTVACDEKYISREENSLLLRQLDAVLACFINSDADVLEFSGQRVSICGLPPFIPRVHGCPKTQATNGLAEHSDGQWSQLENLICSALAEVSGVASTSILKSHNIYHLGLDSISAIKVCSVLRKKEVSISFRDMLKATTISEMAILATKTARSTATGIGDISVSNGTPSLLSRAEVTEALRAARVDQADIEEVLPATATQVHMLSVWQNTQGKVFHYQFRFRLTGKIISERVHSAWESLLEELPILRTTFVSTASRDLPLVQVICKASAVKSRELFRRYIHVDLLAESDGDLVVQLGIHHALYDAVSLLLIIRRFADLCGDKPEQPRNLVNAPERWKNITTPYTLESNRDARKQFWTNYLAGCAPVAVESAAGTTHLESRVSLVDRSAISNMAQIQAACTEKGVSVQALLFAAYASFLASETGAKDVVFGIYLANRAEVDETQQLPFPTLCLVPLRVYLGDQADLFETALKIQQDLVDISSPTNVIVGLWEILDWTGITVDSFVNFLTIPVQGFASAGEEAGGILVEDITGQNVVGLSDKLEYSEPVELMGNPVVDAYPVSDFFGKHNDDSLTLAQESEDVEVSIQGDDMAIGVFGPGQRGKEWPGHVIGGIVDVLGGI